MVFMMWRLILLCATAVCAVPLQPISPRIIQTYSDVCPRLPTYATPFAYQLELQPDFDRDTFQATAYIGVKTDLYGISDDIFTFTLHAEDINIVYSNVYVPSEASESFETMVAKAKNERDGDSQLHTYDPRTHFLTINIGSPLQRSGNYLLIIEYTGMIREDVVGFYKSSYAKGTENERKMYTTQFQPTHARKAFPCFDEPYFKANYTIIITIPNGYSEYNALSNMPVRNIVSREDGGRDVIFYPSLPMSSYLVAWVVSDLPARDDGVQDDGGVKIQAWAPSDSLDWTQYALKITRPLLYALQNYTGIPYKYEFHEPQVLDKIDQVAVPDFMFGAMENWGLITYRDSVFLYNDGSASAKQTVLAYVAHELAHMWFGNLVTTKRWDYTWLNEAFAQFLEFYVAGSAVESDWQLHHAFIANDMHLALDMDVGSSANPLTRDVCSPEEATGAFELLTYVKGASFLRMLNYVIGPDNFQSAIKSYLNKYAFQSVTPEELFSEFANYAGEVGLTRFQFREFLGSWTQQEGHPFLLVDRNYEERTASVTQRQHVFFPPMTNYYYVPISWTYQEKGFNETKPQLFMTSKQGMITLDGMPDSNSWIIVNVQQTGFYRVIYDNQNYDLLIKHLNNNENPLDTIHVINRAQIINDALAFGRSGRLEFDLILRITDYLWRETEYLPWLAAFSGFSYYNSILSHFDGYTLFQKYMYKLIHPHYNKFSFIPPEDHVEKILFNHFTTWACAVGHKHCIRSAVNALQSFLHRLEDVGSDLRSVVYCYGIQNTEDSDWDILWERYTSSRDETDKRLMLKGLSCSRRTERLEQLLNGTIDSEHISQRDRSFVFNAVSSNPLGVTLAFDFLMDKHEEIRKRYGSLSSAVTSVAERLVNLEQGEQLQQFMEERRDELGSNVDAAIEVLRVNLLWIHNILEETIKALEKKNFYRLPTSIIPEQYDIHLEPDLENDEFTGKVEILVRAVESTQTVLIHAQDLVILKESVKTTKVSSSEIISLRSFEEFSSYDLIKIEFQNELQLGEKYIIKIEYSGRLRDDMVGFYKTFYTDDQMQLRKIAATKFAPTHARKAFPCFDEPSFKARFRLTVVVPQSHPSYHCIANAEQGSSTTLENGSREIKFMNTPKMSTYIVAWVVSDLVANEDQPRPTHVKFTTWTRRVAADWSPYSLDVSYKMMERLENYTRYPYSNETDDYPLRKIDQVGTPDFVSGAMENWGLITYRETALLYNDGAAAAKKRVASVIAHELAHMWFGNLITTSWWESTWLNEGFANYFQHLITDEVEEMWNIMDQFVVDQLQYALELDSHVTAKPLTRFVETPADAVDSFASLTYSKGGSILRMLSFIIGENNFRSALQSYVKNNAYGSVTPEDLFEELLPYAYVVGLDQNKMMDMLVSWTEQPGFPVLHVERHYDNSGSITITQERFLSRPGDSAPQLLYSIPLTWVEEEGNFLTPKVEGFLHSSEKSKTLTGFNEDSWIVFNAQQMGFFRVSYDEENWARIVAYLKGPQFDAMHSLNRAQLLDDAFALAISGRMPFERVVQLVDYLQQENYYTPWVAALAGFSTLDRLLHAHQHHEEVWKFVGHLLENVYSVFGFNHIVPRHTDKLLVTAVTARACTVGLSDCRHNASVILRDYLISKIPVPADVRSVVYCHGLRHSSLLGPSIKEVDLWEEMWDIFYDLHDEAERALLLNGLGCTAEEDKLRTLLHRTIEGYGVRKQEATSAFAAVYSFPNGVDVLLDFLHDHFKETQAYLGAMNSILNGVSNRIVGDDQRNNFEALIQKYNVGGLGVIALKTIDGNLEWIKSYGDQCLNEIIKYNSLMSITTPPPPATTSTSTTSTSTTSSSTTSTSTTSTSTTSTSTTSTSTTSTTTTSSLGNASSPSIKLFFFVLCIISLIVI